MRVSAEQVWREFQSVTAAIGNAQEENTVVADG